MKTKINKISRDNVSSFAPIQSNTGLRYGHEEKIGFKAGMLTGREIDAAVNRGEIEIDPYDPARINPNSYNVRLARELKSYDIYRSDRSHQSFKIRPDGTYCCDDFYKVPYIDSKSDNKTLDFIIPDEGAILMPNTLYLGHTIERTATKFYIPAISGRSSIGRLGMCIHITAGFGDIGFDGTWTLEITVVEPLKIYPNMEVAQVYFNTPCGDASLQYNGRYQHQKETTASRLFQGNGRYKYDNKI